MLEKNQIKNYKIRQYINGSFIGLTDINCTKEAYESLLSVMLIPEKNEVVDEYILYNFFIQDKTNRKKLFFKIALPKDKDELDVNPVLLGKIFNKIRADKIITTFGGLIKASNIIKQGRDFEIHVSEYYKNLGYKVLNNFEKQEQDEGIDIILLKDDELQLIQCKNWEIQSIRDKEIKEFLGNCYLFLHKNHEYRRYKKVRRVYITSQSNLDGSAKFLLKDSYPFVEYLHIPFRTKS